MLLPITVACTNAILYMLCDCMCPCVTDAVSCAMERQAVHCLDTSAQLQFVVWNNSNLHKVLTALVSVADTHKHWSLHWEAMQVVAAMTACQLSPTASIKHKQVHAYRPPTTTSMNCPFSYIVKSWPAFSFVGLLVDWGKCDCSTQRATFPW